MKQTSAAQEPLLLRHGAELSIQVILPSAAFASDDVTKTLEWKGAYHTIMFQAKCLADAEAGFTDERAKLVKAVQDAEQAAIEAKIEAEEAREKQSNTLKPMYAHCSQRC